jgi:DNA-binding MarR family transcriptional regulator
MNTTSIRLALTAARAHRLGNSSLSLLCLLADHTSCAMTFAARQLGVTPAAFTGTADALETLGYAARSYNTSDRRGISLEITPRGTTALAAILQGHCESPALAPRKPLGLRLTR